MVQEKSKYSILLPRYRAELKEVRQCLREDAEAVCSDLDVDLTNENSFDVQECKVNFSVLFPSDHRFKREFQKFFNNITEGHVKKNEYEHYLFNLLLDTPRCEHCLAPMENNNDLIKEHINYYHFDIKI